MALGPGLGDVQWNLHHTKDCQLEIGENFGELGVRLSMSRVVAAASETRASVASLRWGFVDRDETLRFYPFYIFTVKNPLSQTLSFIPIWTCLNLRQLSFNSLS